MCVDSYSQMLDLPAFFSSNSEIMGVVCTHGVGRFHEPSRSSNFGAPQSWDPWDTPKSPYVHGENNWELRTFCSQASNLKPLGTGLLSALMTPSSQCLGSGPVAAKYHRVLVRFEACSRIFICLYYIYIIYNYNYLYLYSCLYVHLFIRIHVLTDGLDNCYRGI